VTSNCISACLINLLFNQLVNFTVQINLVVVVVVVVVGVSYVISTRLFVSSLDVFRCLLLPLPIFQGHQRSSFALPDISPQLLSQLRSSCSGLLLSWSILGSRSAAVH